MEVHYALPGLDQRHRGMRIRLKFLLKNQGGQWLPIWHALEVNLNLTRLLRKPLRRRLRLQRLPLAGERRHRNLLLIPVLKQDLELDRWLQARQSVILANRVREAVKIYEELIVLRHFFPGRRAAECSPQVNSHGA